MSWRREELESLVEGSEAEWQRLLDDLEPMVDGLGRDTGLSPAERDEVRGEVIFSLLRHDSRVIRECRAPQAFRSLVRSIARASAGRICGRASARRPRLASDRRSAPLDFDRFAKCESNTNLSLPCPKDLLLGLQNHLTPLQRRIVELRCTNGMSWSEVAGALDCSREAGKKAFGRALTSLRRIGFRFSCVEEMSSVRPLPPT